MKSRVGLARAALFIALISGCGRAQGKDAGAHVPVQTDPAAESFQPPPLAHVRVELADAFGGVAVVDAEVVDTEPLRRRGLMWRRSLAEGKGMLFVFPAPAAQGFWMKNTFIPLDMIFIDATQRVVGVVENAQPHSLVSRGVPTPSLYVLEVAAGFASRRGIRRGAKVRFDGLGRPGE
ncbi:MAG: DUF192 domain-containing protein [Myxococcaceae bacterium]